LRINTDWPSRPRWTLLSVCNKEFVGLILILDEKWQTTAVHGLIKQTVYLYSTKNSLDLIISFVFIPLWKNLSHRLTINCAGTSFQLFPGGGGWGQYFDRLPKGGEIWKTNVGKITKKSLFFKFRGGNAAPPPMTSLKLRSYYFHEMTLFRLFKMMLFIK